LERWLWQQGLPQAAERVFWLHWEEGQRHGDWCSEIPLKRVANICCIDSSTVTRAYQLLKNLGLIRRDSAGRDPDNPFQQATAITEVRIPRDLLTELVRAPNRAIVTRAKADGSGVGETALHPAGTPAAGTPASTAPPAPGIPRPTRQQTQVIWAKTSDGERSRFFTASRDGLTCIEFDPDTRLTATDRSQLLAQLQQLASARSTPTPAASAAPKASRRIPIAPRRRLSLLELARTRKRIQETVPGSHASETLSQVIWAVEEGALRRFELPLALNIALKKIREGYWTKPSGMPSNWARIGTRTEACSAA
jgi:hypothetical protein